MRFFTVAAFTLCSIVGPALAETTVRIGAGTSGFEFGFLYSDHYHAEETVVHQCVDWVGEPDLVVALQLSKVSGIELDVIVEWRRQGVAWYEITHRCHRSTEVYRVDLDRDSGPPYGRAWGYWKKHPKQDIVLSDDEIRAFAALKAMSDYTGQPASQIVTQRKQGRSPRDIAAASKKHGKSMAEDTSSPRPEHGKSKAQGKKR